MYCFNKAYIVKYCQIKLNQLFFIMDVTMNMKRPKRKEVSNDFLQSYLGGEFSSVRKYKIGRPTVFTGIIKKISLENGILTFYRVVDDHKIEVCSSYRVYRYYNDNRITFESTDLLHTVILYKPKLKE